MKTSRILSLSLPSFALAAVLADARTAHAGIEACGDIHVTAEAQCKMEVGAECELHCEPVSFEAACAAKLEASCAGECTAMADVQCTADCQGTCQGQCEADPGNFDCSGSCQADCSGSCAGSCSSDDSECRASCEATCSAECDASCMGTPPTAECQARCEGSCSGSCTGQARVDCQVMCQADGYLDCKADLEGGCRGECNTEQGALFCDGEYVDHGGNLDECVDSLRALLDIEVEGYASGECNNGMCHGEAGGSISCAVDPSTPPWWAVALPGVAGLMRRRRAV